MNNFKFAKHINTLSDSVIGINPEGGYVSGWKLRNPRTGQFEDILYQGSSQKRSGIPVLFPQFSSAKGMRSHGFARDSFWNIESLENDRVLMCLDSSMLAGDAKKEYGYPFQANILVTFQEDPVLTYKLTVRNTGSTPMPVSPGLHPYWAIPHEHKKDMKIVGLPGFNAQSFDWDKNPPDNPYDYSEKITISIPGRMISIEDISEPGVIKHIVVWSQTPQKEDFHFVCVEPVCGYMNALDSSPILIQPGREWNMVLRFTVTFV